MRAPAIQSFLDALEKAFAGADLSDPAKACMARVFAIAAKPVPSGQPEGGTPPVLQFLPAVLTGLSTRSDAIGPLATTLTTLAPDLRWTTRKKIGPTASEGFTEAHANTLILGPGGLEPRDDVWIGLSLMAPGTRYPDHDHPPEEVYLVLSDGAFFQGGAGWRGRGVGDTVYNPPGILHAMRAADTPFLAIWCLPI